MKRGTNETAIGRRINPRRFSLPSLIATAMHANCGFDSARLNKSYGVEGRRGNKNKKKKKRLKSRRGSFDFCNQFDKQSVEF